MIVDEKELQMTWYLVFFTWLIAFTATCGSLFFSEIMEFRPCTLCWYQRIFMYPLVFILIQGSFHLNKELFNYTMPFIGMGWLVALYHNFIQWEIIPESLSPCVEGVPCSAMWINWLGFVTIPFLSLIAFTSMAIIMLIYYRRLR